MKTINRLKKITKNKSIIEERKNLVHVCNSVANLAEGVPLAGNGNISHSDQRFNIKEAGLKPCFFYVTLSPRRKCELPVPEVTRLRTMSCEKTEYNESEQSIADFIAYAIVCVIETEYEAEKWKISKIQKL